MEWPREVLEKVAFELKLRVGVARGNVQARDCRAGQEAQGPRS